MDIIFLLILGYLAIGCIIGIVAVIVGYSHVADQQDYLIEVFLKWLFCWPYWIWKLFFVW